MACPTAAFVPGQPEMALNRGVQGNHLNYWDRRMMRKACLRIARNGLLGLKSQICPSVAQWPMRDRPFDRYGLSVRHWGFWGLGVRFTVCRFKVKVWAGV